MISVAESGAAGEIDPDSYSNGGISMITGALSVADGDVLDLRGYFSAVTSPPTYEGWIEVEVLEGDLIGYPALVDDLPATIGAEGQILKVADGAIVWADDGEAAEPAPDYPHEEHSRWRLVVRTNVTWIGLSEIEMRGRDDVDQATGGTASASSYYGTSYPALAFNDGAGGWYSSYSGNSWIAYQFTAPVALWSLTLTIGTNTTDVPTEFDLQYSDDGTTWTTVATFTGLAWSANETKTFSIVETRFGSGAAIEEVAGTTYTQVADDARKWKATTSADAVTVTINPNVNVTADEITFEQAGAGAVTFSAGSGMTLLSRGGALAIAGQYGVAGVKFKSPTEAVLFGDLA